MSRGYVPFEEVRMAALSAAATLVARWAPGGKMASRDEYQPLNPLRSDKRPGAFSINLRSGRWLDHGDDARGGDLISLYAYLHGLDYHEAALVLAEELGVECKRPGDDLRARAATAKARNEAHAEARRAEASARPAQPSKNLRWAREIWAEARPIAGTVAARYLEEARGIAGPPPASLRFARLTHKRTGKERHPAMVAPMIAPDGKLGGVHRTYLTEDARKAGLDPPRAMLGDPGPAPLFPAGPALGLCEGIETALSLRAVLPELPVWAALSSGGFARVAAPPGVRKIVLAPDGDRTLDAKRLEWRRPAAAQAKETGRAFERLGIAVFLYVPPAGRDLNDLLREEPDRLREAARHIRAFLAMPAEAAA